MVNTIKVKRTDVLEEDGSSTIHLVNVETGEAIDTANVKHKKFATEVAYSFRKGWILKPWSDRYTQKK